MIELVEVENITELKDASEIKPISRTMWCSNALKVDERLVHELKILHAKQEVRKLAIAIAMVFG